MALEMATIEGVSDIIRDKVRGVLANSMPSDLIDRVIKGEFKKYFNDRIGGYDSETKGCTLFEMDIRKQVAELMKPVIKEEVEEALAGHAYMPGDEVISILAKALAPDLLKQMSESVVQGMIISMRSLVSN